MDANLNIFAIPGAFFTENKKVHKYWHQTILTPRTTMSTQLHPLHELLSSTQCKKQR